MWCSQSASFSDGEDWAVVVYGKAEQNVVVFTNHLCSRDDDLRDLDWHCLFDCVLFPCARLRVRYQDLVVVAKIEQRCFGSYQQWFSSWLYLTV